MTRKTTAAPISSVGDILRQVVRDLDEKKAISEEKLFSVWREAVGEKCASHSRPVSLRRGEMRVVVDHPGWLQILTLNKRKALKKLQSGFGKDKISEIRFRIGQLGP